jgi:hypothetical protein
MVVSALQNDCETKPAGHEHVLDVKDPHVSIEPVVVVAVVVLVLEVVVMFDVLWADVDAIVVLSMVFVVVAVVVGVDPVANVAV